MERPKKPYYQFSPRFHPDKKFPPPDKTLDVRDTKQRRVHMSDYFVFMRPEIAHILREYGRRANRAACQKLYDYGSRALPEKYFAFMIDRTMWMFWFLPFAMDAPRWPWNLKFPTELARGEIPCQIFARYCNERAAREANIRAFNESIEPSPAVATDDSLNAGYIVRSKAIFSNATSDGIPLLDAEAELRKGLWEEVFREGYRSSYAIAPFEVELPWSTPLDTFVTKDLPSINKFVPACVKVQLNLTNRRIIVAFGEGIAATMEDASAARHTLIRTWEHVCSWVVLVGQHKDVTLLQHLKAMHA